MIAELTSYAPVAQLDRASGFEPEGRGFESLRAYQSALSNLSYNYFIVVIIGQETKMKKDDKDSSASKAYKTAFKIHMEAGCCPQGVLCAVQQAVGHVSDDTIKSSHGLSGGGSLYGIGMCGALTGGLIALGTQQGRSVDDIYNTRSVENFQAGKQLVDKFQREFHGLTCEDLQKQFSGQTWNLWDDDEADKFSDARGDKCAHAVGKVSEWAVEIMKKS
jgi:C_GCAxxG_C_C family probable redox protein